MLSNAYMSQIEWYSQMNPVKFEFSNSYMRKTYVGTALP